MRKALITIVDTVASQEINTFRYHSRPETCILKIPYLRTVIGEYKYQYKVIKTN